MYDTEICLKDEMDMKVNDTLSIPIALLREETILRETPRFIEEIEMWCTSELCDDYAIRHESMSIRKNPYYPFQAYFNSETDAIMFKMRWM